MLEVTIYVAALLMPLILMIVDYCTYNADFDPFYPTPCMFRRRHPGVYTCYMGISFALLFHVKTFVAYYAGSPGILAFAEVLLLYTNLGLVYSKESHTMSIWLIFVLSAVQITLISRIFAAIYMLVLVFIAFMIHHLSAGRPYSTGVSIGLFLMSSVYFLSHLIYLTPMERKGYVLGREYLEVFVSSIAVTFQATSVLYWDVYLARKNNVGLAEEGEDDKEDDKGRASLADDNTGNNTSTTATTIYQGSGDGGVRLGRPSGCPSDGIDDEVAYV